MSFFDLSLPYDGKNAGEGKSLLVKLATKAMELGYVGIAYNRSIKGIMSEKDRCAIPLLTVESLLKFAPPLTSSVGFHRDLLGVRRDTPFRQYTRLTVAVESNAQSLALNSDNPILKSYDIVAVRPLNQSAFDQACEKAKVDIISIEFSGNMPFRLKHHMVKAAVQRGIHFEIRYSDLLVDAHKRRQVISNAKLLVDWTRGKNLIISSGAPSVTELRGPNDVTNLMSLLGLSTEKARAALSKNCRNMISNALRKKLFYKDTVRIELASSNEKFNLEQLLPGDWLRYDPLSSGDGDMALDDLAKAFGATNNASSKSAKAIDFTSVLDDLPSRGFQVNDIIKKTKFGPHPPVDKANDEPVQSNQASELPLTVPTEPDGNLLEDGPLGHTSDQRSQDENKVESMTVAAEQETSETNGSYQEPGLMLQGQAEAFQTLTRGMELDDAASHANQHSSSASEDRPLLNSVSWSPEDNAKILTAGFVPVDDAVMDVDDNKGATSVAFHDMPLRRHDDKKQFSGFRDNTLAGDVKLIVDDDSSCPNHNRTEEVVMEDKKYEIGETGSSLYNMFCGITDLVREPVEHPGQDPIAADQSPKLREEEEPLVRHHEDVTMEHEPNEETEDRNGHQISVLSLERTSALTSGKPRGKKKRVHPSQLQPFKAFLHPSRFKRIGKRSKHRRPSSSS
ncbi:PREDICTED: uncharacterized protein LOC104809599 [Tarenaya hassleriana]|uniref:uncharacterized protein LOC104809599 n=1 Tax=Tarenaya hassleriana TaxID=28532 RepID=UPI00053C5C72|nr:PREDICTED: uncharacterized protein LOC104809599 [Tarenaya hassleriana]